MNVRLRRQFRLWHLLVLPIIAGVIAAMLAWVARPRETELIVLPYSGQVTAFDTPNGPVFTEIIRFGIGGGDDPDVKINKTDTGVHELIIEYIHDPDDMTGIQTLLPVGHRFTIRWRPHEFLGRPRISIKQAILQYIEMRKSQLEGDSGSP